MVHRIHCLLHALEHHRKLARLLAFTTDLQRTTDSFMHHHSSECYKIVLIRQPVATHLVGIAYLRGCVLAHADRCNINYIIDRS